MRSLPVSTSMAPISTERTCVGPISKAPISPMRYSPMLSSRARSSRPRSCPTASDGSESAALIHDWRVTRGLRLLGLDLRRFDDGSPLFDFSFDIFLQVPGRSMLWRSNFDPNLPQSLLYCGVIDRFNRCCIQSLNDSSRRLFWHKERKPSGRINITESLFLRACQFRQKMRSILRQDCNRSD